MPAVNNRIHDLLFTWGEHQRATLKLTGWQRRVPLTKILQGEPRSGGFHAQLPRGVEFSRPEDLGIIARVQDAMDQLRHQDERGWLALALYAVLPAPYLSDLDRARIAQVELSTYRGLVKTGLGAIRARLFPAEDGGCPRKANRAHG